MANRLAGGCAAFSVQAKQAPQRLIITRRFRTYGRAVGLGFSECDAILDVFAKTKARSLLVWHASTRCGKFKLRIVVEFAGSRAPRLEFLDAVRPQCAKGTSRLFEMFP